VVSWLFPERRWDYLGNMMTISFAGAILLMPILFLARFIPLSPLVACICFLGVAGLMLLEHIRRSKLLGIGWALTISWVLYRIILLVIINYGLL
jgi:hypothetical protein